MINDQKLNDLIHYTIEIVIRLGFLLMLIALCLQLLLPFYKVMLWGVILALATEPLYESLRQRLGGKRKTAAIILAFLGLIAILAPTLLFIDTMIEGAKQLKTSVEDGSLSFPAPNEKVADWPVIGPKTYEVWKQTSENLTGLISKYQSRIIYLTGIFFNGALSVGGSVIQFVFATLIAGILLATKGKSEATHKFFDKLFGNKSNELIEVIKKTVHSVIKGVIGVAFIQATLIGLGFILAGIPYAGGWALLVLILAILQLPTAIIVVPIIFYLFSVSSTVPAILWTIYLALASASDNILKPIFLGKGAPVPMLVIFLGVIGGFIGSGFIGMFTGAIILSIGYKLFLSWLEVEEEKAPQALN